MKKPKITEKNIRSYLKTKRDNKYYFKFPWFKKHQTLIVELEDVKEILEDKNINTRLFIKELVAESAFNAYRKRIKNEKT